MARESSIARRARTEAIISSLQRSYPNAHCELNFRNPLELLIATILSAQCSDKQVNLVTASLFARYHSADDYANADPAELTGEIRRLGLFRNKARSIQACCRKLIEQHAGEVPRSMDELTALEGVGRKTANVVIGNAFGANAGIVVDTHVTRVGTRLRLTSERTPERIERELMKLVSREHWTRFSHWLIWHGRRRCFARNPDCPHCEIRELCPSAGKVI